ncbi:MAG TPA: LbtU family siderophore porin [Gammaproteobacteria bacterium]|nr:LbtU family siderophore porin [Gammaproteobacteria bacterium]
MKAKLSLLTVALSTLFLTPGYAYAASADSENAMLKQEVSLLKQEATQEKHAEQRAEQATAQMNKRINMLEAKIDQDDTAHAKEEAQTRAVVTQISARTQSATPTTSDQSRYMPLDTSPITASVSEVPGSLHAAPASASSSSSSWFEKGDASYIKDSFPNFYEIVTQNSPKSYANNNMCIDGMICFSGQMNFDLRFVERGGGTSIPGSVLGIGTRPVFAPRQAFSKTPQVLGSINNVDLFIDAAVNKWMSAHIDLAYLNGSQQTKTFAHNQVDWGSAYRDAALKVNQAYALFADPCVTPLFVQVGRVYLNFGDYQPFPVIESLTQLLEEGRTGGVIAGAILPDGFYASGNYSMAQQSIENENVLGTSFSFAGREKERNFGGKLGFRNTVGPVFINANVSYIDDMRDMDYLNEAENVLNNDYTTIFQFGGIPVLNSGVIFNMQRAPGAAGHIDARIGRYDFGWDYVSALKDLNAAAGNSKISAWGVDGNVNFALPVVDYPSNFDVTYQRAKNSSVYQTIPTGLGPITGFVATPGNILPKLRIQSTLSTEVMRNVTLSGTFVDDKDTPISSGGTGRWSYMYIARISVDV